MNMNLDGMPSGERIRMLRGELDAIAKAIRDTPMSKSARKHLVSTINRDVLLVNRLHNHKRFRLLAIPEIERET